MAQVPESMIYLVYCGEADEHEPACLLRASRDRAKCEAFVTERELRDKQMLAWFELKDSLRTQFEEADPRPEYSETEDVPSWGSGLGAKDITPQMREERNAILARNQIILERESKIVAAWDARLDEALKKGLLENGVPEDLIESILGGWSYHWQNKYWIREIREL